MLIAVQLLILVLVMAGQLAAQNVNSEALDAETLPSAPSETISTPPQPQPERVLDKKFFIVMGALGGAESFRFSSRKLVVDNMFAAGAPWVTGVPSNPGLVAKYAGLYAAEMLVAYELKKRHDWLPGDRVIRKLWWVYPVAMTVLHLKNAVGNVRTTGPGGCTSIECAEQMQ